MIRPVASSEDHRERRTPWLFIVAEVVLLAALPVIAIVGVDTLLETKAGTFVAQPGPDDPGWEVLVSPSPVTAVVEMVDGTVSGLVLVTQPAADQRGGVAIIIPADMLLTDVPAPGLPPEQAVADLAVALRLRIPTTEIIDAARWSDILGGEVVMVDNPDPVVGTDGSPLFDVGTVGIGADQAADFLGRTSADAPAGSGTVRRQLWWEALLASPPQTDDPLAVLLNALATGPHDVETLPVTRTEVTVADRPAVDVLIGRAVPFPAGAGPDDRIRVRVLDRRGSNDIEAVARTLGAQGYEVVRIGNAARFDDGSNELVVPIGLATETAASAATESLVALADQFDAATVQAADDTDAAELATLVIAELPGE